MAEPCPYAEQFALSYNGKHPIMDIGCAMGLNVQTAVEAMDAVSDSGEDEAVRILAADFEPAHLEFVDALQFDGVRTIHCKLPTEMPAAELDEFGGLSAVLLSEVLHFLTGPEIEASLAWIFDALVPGGKLFITACSPYYNMGSDRQKLVLQHQKEERIKKNKWPLSPDDDFAPLSFLSTESEGDEGTSGNMSVVSPTPDTEVFAPDIDVSQQMPNSLHVRFIVHDIIHHRFAICGKQYPCVFTVQHYGAQARLTVRPSVYSAMYMSPSPPRLSSVP